MKNLFEKFAVVTFIFGFILFAVETTQAKDCDWTVSGVVKVQVPAEHPELITKFGAQIPLKGIKVKVSGATIGWFDSWDTVTTDKDGKFTVKKAKSCEDRKLKIEVMFDSDELELRTDTVNPLTGLGSMPPLWYTIVEDDERRRKAGAIQILPTVFDAGKLHALSNSTARDHAILWVIAKTLRDHVASYGEKFKFTKKSVIEYPNNDPLIGDDSEASFCNPFTDVVNIFKSNDGKDDHLGVNALFHEMMHSWAYQHSKAEIDLATNLLATGSTHCFNNKEHVSFHEGFAEFAEERLKEEIFPRSFGTTLPFNRDAFKEGLQCEGGVDKINSLLDVERHEFGWMSLLRMLTTKDLYKFSYAGEATSTSRTNASVFISQPAIQAITGTCSRPTNLTLKNILDVFLPHTNKGFNKNLEKSEMNVDDFMNRSAKILGFEDQKTTLINLLDPTKTSEPKEGLCGGTLQITLPRAIQKP